MFVKTVNIQKFSPQIILAAGFILGVVISLIFFGFFYLFDIGKVQTNSKDDEQIRTKGQKFTSPLLECSDIRPLRVDLFSKLENKLMDSVSEGVDEDGVEMSVYLRDLSNGGWLEVGSKDLYQPASLMKLPTLIAAYKKYDTTPEYFSEQVEASLPYGVNAIQNIVTGEPLVEGQTISVEDLVKRTVIYSDNMAHDTLVNKIGIVRIESILKDFGIPPLTSPEDYKISPREYARFLRILYNATYLSQKSSEDLLSLLTKSKFDKGIRAGIPKNVMIASKFGERGMRENGKIVYQLHDCGIVYASRPYVLCIMTKGPSFDPLYKKIASVSKLVYGVMQ